MSYYILPKKHTNIEIDPSLIADVLHSTLHIPPLKPIVSHSLISYLKEVNLQLTNATNVLIIDKDRIECSIDFFCKIVNPYEFIFSKVPGSKFSVSKLKPYSNMFYIMLEILSMFNLLEHFADKNIKTIHFGKNNHATIECMNMLREDNNDINYELDMSEINGFLPLHSDSDIDIFSVDFFYFELNNEMYTNDNSYIIGLTTILCHILTYQSANGISIIKVDTLFTKPVLDVLYILTSLYDKVCITKPNTSRANKTDRYIVCKNFICNASKIPENKIHLIKLTNLLTTCAQQHKCISSLIKNDLPYYFLNKVEDSNIIIGHQLVEFTDQLINIIKNKNRIDKIETLKKNNIQKCIQWCEKYKIPSNKFVDKINIFLPVNIYDENIFLEEIRTGVNLFEEIEEDITDLGLGYQSDTFVDANANTDINIII
jgi:23S rRNA U2552 (ribose-2'-O)-methylase RlmE/FtsJ